VQIPQVIANTLPQSLQATNERTKFPKNISIRQRADNNLLSGTREKGMQETLGTTMVARQMFSTTQVSSTEVNVLNIGCHYPINILRLFWFKARGVKHCVHILLKHLTSNFSI
jgi:hypothetical protein